MKDLRFVCEEWKIIPEFDEYEVSNFGRVRSIDRYKNGRHGKYLVKGKELKQTLDKKGYPQVRFRKGETHARLVHRIVAKAFIKIIDGCNQVNHKNGLKTDNRVDNLEWVNNSQNQLHAYKNGLQPSRAGERNVKAILTDAKVTELKKLYNSGKLIVDISKTENINISIIRDIIYGRTWKSNNFPIFKRDDRKKIQL